jgi:hypothetical protein
MAQIRAESKPLASSACLCACVLGCGDIGDAQVPLPIHRGSREPPDGIELTPTTPAAGPARAVASVRVSPPAGAPATEAACTTEFEALLPDASAISTLVNGQGVRAIDGEGAHVVCRVAPRPGSDGVFELIASVRNERLLRFFATGELGPTTSGVVALQLTTFDATDLVARCTVEIREVLDGAAWLHSVGCQTTASAPGAGGCDVAVSALFENCRE